MAQRLGVAAARAGGGRPALRARHHGELAVLGGDHPQPAVHELLGTGGVDGLSLFTDGAVRFSVYADGERVWQSAALGHEDPPASVQVSLAGRKSLRLVVEKAGPGSLPTLASWADSVLNCR